MFFWSNALHRIRQQQQGKENKIFVAKKAAKKERVNIIKSAFIKRIHRSMAKAKTYIFHTLMSMRWRRPVRIFGIIHQWWRHSRDVTMHQSLHSLLVNAGRNDEIKLQVLYAPLIPDA